MKTTHANNHWMSAGALLAIGFLASFGPIAQGQTPAPAVEIFLKIDGVAGDAKGNGHEGWIAVDSFNYGITRPAGPDQKAGHRGLTLVKGVDKASPFLYLYCSNGRPLEEVVLEITHTTGDHMGVQEFRMRRATITSVQTSGSTGNKEATERLTLQYQAVAWTYLKIDPLTGSVISELTMQWELPEDES